jgi:Uncharacterized protein conserved in bacteria (DUF2188)
MAKRGQSVHTVPHPDGRRWINTVGGQEVGLYLRHDAAAEEGRRIAMENHAEHIIHRRGGTIGRIHRYGGDPNPHDGGS